MIDIISSNWTLIAFHAYPECIDIPSQLLTDSILQHFHHLQLVFYWALGLQIGSAVADENQFLQSVHQQIVLSVFAVGFELIPRLFVLLSLCYFFVSLFIALIYWEVKLSRLRIQVDELLSPSLSYLSPILIPLSLSSLTMGSSLNIYSTLLLTLFSSSFFHHFILLFDWSSLSWAELRRSVPLLALFQT